MCLLTFGDPIFSAPTITGENARETPEKQQRIRKNRAQKTGEAKKGILSKTGRILSKIGKPEIFAEKGRFPAKRVGISAVLIQLQSCLLLFVHLLYFNFILLFTGRGISENECGRRQKKYRGHTARHLK